MCKPQSNLDLCTHTTPKLTDVHKPKQNLRSYTQNPNLTIIYKCTQTQDSKYNVHFTLTNYQTVNTQVYHTMPIYYHTHLILLLHAIKLHAMALPKNTPEAPVMDFNFKHLFKTFFNYSNSSVKCSNIKLHQMQITNGFLIFLK
jgi:hypothetical protein